MNDLRLGTSMIFMESPEPRLVPNQPMDNSQKELAVEFVEELKSLGVLKAAAEHNVKLENNFPLCLVPKPGQPGQYMYIDNGARGGQNEKCVADPCFMTSPDHILPKLYRNGWSATLDMSKYFHLFLTAREERKFLGLIHPGTEELHFYDKLPMGTCNSPGASGRFGAAFLRIILRDCPLFQGTPINNTKVAMVNDSSYRPELGEGKVLIGSDGLPTLIVWLHVDDIFFTWTNSIESRSWFIIYSR